jgi:hypothetical protein
MISVSRSWRRILILGAGLIALAGLTAATSLAFGASRGSSGRGAGHAPAAGATSGPAWPAPATAADTVLLNNAEQLLLARCMGQRGFSYWPEALAPEVGTMQFFGLAPVSSPPAAGAAQRGGTAPSNAQRNSGYYGRLPGSRRGAYLTALNGAEGSPGATVRLPEGPVMGHSIQGCTAAAQRELYGNYAAWFRAAGTVAQLRPMWLGQVAADRTFTRAVARWSRCVRAAGFGYPSPAALASALRTRAEGRAARLARAGRAGARCTRDQGLPALVRSLVHRYSGALIRTYRKEVIAYRLLQSGAIPRARLLTRSPAS